MLVIQEAVVGVFAAWFFWVVLGAGCVMPWLKIDGQ
jgi:type III secretory pathway component EscT